MEQEQEPRPIGNVLHELTLSIRNAAGFIQQLPADNVPTILKSFVQLREYRDQMRSLTAIIDGLYDEVSTKTIPGMMESLQVDNLKLKSPKRLISLGVRFNASIPVDKREKGFKWLEDNNLGSLVQRNVNPKALSSAINAYVKETAKEPPEDCISIHKQVYTQIRKD